MKHVLDAVVKEQAKSSRVGLNAIKTSSKPLTVDEAKARLNMILERFQADLEALGEQVRQEIVAPVARRHRMYFASGMGVYSFKKDALRSDYSAPVYSRPEDLDVEYMSSEYDLSASAKAALRPVLELLVEEIDRNHDFGQYVGDAP
jgi:hypothetical protein